MEMGTHVMFASESIEGIYLWGYSCDLVWAFCCLVAFMGALSHLGFLCLGVVGLAF